MGHTAHYLFFFILSLAGFACLTPEACVEDAPTKTADGVARTDAAATAPAAPPTASPIAKTAALAKRVLMM